MARVALILDIDDPGLVTRKLYDLTAGRGPATFSFVRKFAEAVNNARPVVGEGEEEYPKPTMDEFAWQIHEITRDKGFWDHEKIDPPESALPNEVIPNPSIVPEKLALIHSEVSEALEAHRDDESELFEEELADVIIRVLDLAQALGMSMNTAVAAKVEKNRARPHLHGRKH